MSKGLRLLLLCAGFAAVLAAGSLYVWSQREHPPTALANVQSDKERTNDRADRFAAEVLKRPLFTQGRQPPEVKIVKAEPPKLQGRLAGVMLRPDGRIALFTRPGGRPISVKEGDVIDGWTTAKIEEGRVLLTSSFGEQIVKPTNGSAEELTPGRRPAKKAVAVKNQPNQAGTPTQNPAKPQKPQQQANGAAATGQK
jgi:hypothetical protein